MSNVNAPFATRRYFDITDQVRQPHVINNKLIGAQSAETSSKEDGTIVGGILPTPLKGVIFLRDAKIDDPNVSRWQIVPEFDKIHIRSCMAGDRAPPSPIMRPNGLYIYSLAWKHIYAQIFDQAQWNLWLRPDVCER